MKTTSLIPRNKVKPLLVLVYLGLPCLLAWLLFSRWFPYHLTGKQFLVFYGLHMLTGYLILFWSRKLKERKGLPQLFLGISLTIALCRMGQGLYHHKPVLYLCLLTGIHFIVTWIAGKGSAKAKA